jgi:hypothetical protein
MILPTPDTMFNLKMKNGSVFEFMKSINQIHFIPFYFQYLPDFSALLPFSLSVLRILVIRTALDTSSPEYQIECSRNIHLPLSMSEEVES